VITRCLPEGRDEGTDAPVSALRICLSGARSPSPELGRRQRPEHGHPARSKRGTRPGTAVFRRRVSRDRTARLLACWIRTVAPRRTTAAPATAWAGAAYPPARETPLDTGSSRWPGGAVSAREPTSRAARAKARRDVRGTCGS